MDSNNEQTKCKGHVMFFGTTEVFQTGDGTLYRAPMNYPIDSNGYRQGARWEAPAHLAEERIAIFKDFAVQNPLF